MPIIRYSPLILSAMLAVLSSTVGAEPNGGGALQVDYMDFDRAAKIESAVMATAVLGGAFTPNIGAEARLSLNVGDWLEDWRYQPGSGKQFPSFKSAALFRFTIPFQQQFGLYGLVGGEFVLVSSRSECHKEVVQQNASSSPIGVPTSTIEQVCNTHTNGHSGLVAGGGIRMGDPDKVAFNVEVMKRLRNANGLGYTTYSIRISQGF